MVYATKQLTIRNLPPNLDRALRKRANISGKSINQIVIDYIAAQSNLSPDNLDNSLIQNLSWFIGKGMDNETLQALQGAKAEQKALAASEMHFVA